MIIKKYSYKERDQIDKFLIDYRDTLDYRYIFASREWLLSFLEIYKPEDNFLILSQNYHNYFSLSIIDNNLVFTGDPFNDFNGVFVKNTQDKYNFKEIIHYFLKIGFDIKFFNLFEDCFINELLKIDNILEASPTIGLKILCKGGSSTYNIIVSKRIHKMYTKFSEKLIFFRIFGDEIKNNSYILNNLFSNRRNKLLSKKKEEYNLSFEHSFDEFIKTLISFDTIFKNVFIDYCVHKDTGIIMASTLNFVKDKKVICYLRAHAQLDNTISYGLILDYWSNNENFHDGVEIIDLSRGNEFYKYRLGAKEYKLANFVII
jgi:hypothetical protein